MKKKQANSHDKPLTTKSSIDKNFVTNPKATANAVNLKLILGIIAALFGFILYASTIGHDYCLDDVAVIKSNSFTQMGVSGIPTLLRTYYWQGSCNINAGLYRPLSMILFAIEWQFFPNAPHVYHFVNVLLHALIGYLLFSLLTKLFAKTNLVFPFIVTLLFLAHPIHTEVVANIKSADEL